MCWVGFIFVYSFEVTPIALADKVLLHLVLLRCEVVSVEFLYRKSVSYLSIHVELLLLLYDVSCAGCDYGNRLVLRVGLGTIHAKAMGLDQATKHSDTM